MRRAIVTVLALGALSLFAAAAHAAGPSAQLVEAGGARFPDRAFVLTLPTRTRLAPGQVRAFENGVPVSGLSVVPVGAAGRDAFGVVLVIDSTLTMRSPAIDDAVAAARAFAARRSPNQQLAIVTFNNQTKVLLPFTTSDAAVDQALSSTPALACCTPLYDAVQSAVALVEKAEISAGSVIVLSDGADTGSKATAAQVINRARKSHVRIFSVAIRSRAFRAGPLKNLAVASGGAYSETNSTSDLARIYSQLGDRLSSEYLLRYRSHAGPNEKVRVVVRIAGREDEFVSGYVTPRLPAVAGATSYHRSKAATIWQSPVTMLIVTLVAAGLFAVGLVAIIRPRRGDLRRRMAHFVTLRTGGSAESDDLRLTGKVFAGAERSLETTKWWARFVETLELAEIRMQAVHLLLWTFVGTLFTMWLFAVLGGSLLFGLIGLAVPLGVRVWIRRKVDKKRALFAEQLPDNLQVLASALRAGHSLVGALSVVVEDATEPSRTEFRRVIGDEQLGVPLEAAIEVVVRRMENRDLAQVGLVAALQRQTGGNMAEVLDRVTESIRERFELRRMVQTLTAQGRMSRWVVSLLPVVLLVAITLLNPTYVEPLYTETFGRVLLAFSAVMLVAGSFVIKKIVDIKL